MASGSGRLPQCVRAALAQRLVSINIVRVNVSVPRTQGGHEHGRQETSTFSSHKMADPLGSLASHKWAASQARAAAAAAAAAAARVQACAAASAFAAYGSDSEEEGAARMAAVAEYESGEEGGGRGAEGGDGGGERDAIRATHSPRSVGARGGGEGEGGALACGRDDTRESTAVAAAKRRRVLPASCAALTDAKSAVEDRLSLQPKEPSKEERRAELNAEQARRIEELFFWCECMSARTHTSNTADVALMRACAGPGTGKRMGPSSETMRELGPRQSHSSPCPIRGCCHHDRGGKESAGIRLCCMVDAAWLMHAGLPPNRVDQPCYGSRGIEKIDTLYCMKT